MQASETDGSVDERQMLRDSAAEFVRRRQDMKALRERRGSLPGHDPAVVREMAELGWFGIGVPGELGGLGLGLAELAIVLEELGRGLMGEPLAAAAFAGRVIQVSGNAALKARLLSGLIDGTALPAVAWQEGFGGIEVDGGDTRAEACGGGFTLTGNKRFVAGAGAAAGYLVSAHAEDGLGLFWVPAGAAGLVISHEWRADGTPAARLALERVRVMAADVLCEPGEAGAVLNRALDDAAVLASAEMLGVMQASLAMALEYMRTRVQFGKPIGSFQSLQHKATDLYVQQELARAVLDDALRALDGDTDATARVLIASRCKARASDAGLRVTREVIQLHGAIGFTDEYDAGLYLKRALVLSAWLGNASAHRRRYADHAPAFRDEVAEETS